MVPVKLGSDEPGKEELLTPMQKRVLENPIYPTMLSLAWPVILAQAVNISYSVIDSIFLGRLGKEPFSAPVIGWPVVFLFYSIGLGFVSGGLSIISQYFGSGERKKLSTSISKLISFSILISLVLSGVSLLILDHILFLLGIPMDVYGLARTYLHIVLIGIPFGIFYMAFVTIINSFGDTRTPMYLSVFSALFNIFLDPLLIYGLLGFPRLEVKGAALATLVSRITVALIASILLVKRLDSYNIRLRMLMPDRDFLSIIIKTGGPIAFQRSTNSLGSTVLIGLVARFGSTALASYGVALRVIDLLQVFVWGINRAVAIMVGQNIGAGKTQRAITIAKNGIILVVSFLTLTGGILVLFAPYVVTVFVDDMNVVSEGSFLLKLFALSIPFFGLYFIGSGVATGSGHTRVISIISFLRLWVFRIGLAYLLAYLLYFDEDGVWYSIVISNIIAGVLSFIWVLRSHWYKGIIKK